MQNPLGISNVKRSGQNTSAVLVFTKMLHTVQLVSGNGKKQTDFTALKPAICIENLAFDVSGKNISGWCSVTNLQEDMILQDKSFSSHRQS